VNPQSSIQEISRSIREKALTLGFADCGFSKAEQLTEDANRLQLWLHKGHHAGMKYMENHFEKRTDPTKLVEGAFSVISLLYSYHTDQRQKDPAAPVLSTYAFGKDYHLVLKDKMHQLLDFIRLMEPETKGRVFVDSAPVLDRAWARKAGLGWIGKNSNLISRKHGSFVFVGEIILNLQLDYNQIPENDFCGSCTRCIDACPTGAILGDRTLDAGLCISYQTIEHKGEIDPALKGKFKNRVFGCDICQEVCPWNRKVLKHKEPEFEPDPELMGMSAQQWTGLDPENFNRLFRHTPVMRAGYDKIMETQWFNQENEENIR
jgi:epoxyqueuosine reductase